MLTGQNMDRDARHPFPQGCNKRWAVIGIADRGGCQNLKRRGPHGPSDSQVTVHNHKRLGDTVFVQPAGRLESPSKPQHGFLIENRHRVAGMAFIDDQSDGIGAKVDNTAARQWGRRGKRH